MGTRRLGLVVVVCLALVAGACGGDSRERLRSTGVPSESPAEITFGTPSSPRPSPAISATASVAPSVAPTSGSSVPSGSPPASATASPEPTAQPTPTFPSDLSGGLDIWTFAQGDDEVPMKAYIKAFRERFPRVEPKLIVIPEDNYTSKINIALQAHHPPDIAVIEDERWSKAGRVVELTAKLQEWAVDIADFNRGGLARMTLEGDPSKGVFAVGDFLGGFPLVYNKAIFDAAGVAYPPSDRSLTIQEYADICRKLAKPAADPSKALYGCAMHDFAFSLIGSLVFGADGRTIRSNGDSQMMIDAFDVGTALVRDKVAPSGSVMDAIGGESDLFAQGKIAMTGSDFTEVPKYRENGIGFGLAPIYVMAPGMSTVDTFTAPWGTFTESKDPRAALEFLRFIATDGQRIRTEVTPDPPLSKRVADAVGYGSDDPIKAQYLQVLQLSQPTLFVPEGLEAWDPGEVVRLMTVEHQTDAAPILHEMVAKAQVELDRVWQQWEALGP